MGCLNSLGGDLFEVYEAIASDLGVFRVVVWGGRGFVAAAGWGFDRRLNNGSGFGEGLLAGSLVSGMVGELVRAGVIYAMGQKK